MKHYQITLGDQTFDVKVLGDPRQEQVEVEVNGQAVTVRVKPVAEAVTAAGIEPPPEAPSGPEPAAAAAAPTGKTVHSPLPGVVKSIAVRPGQQVAVNDPLLVIEAMKMDNVIRAQRAGVIGAVLVSEGSQIAHGAALVEYRE